MKTIKQFIFTFLPVLLLISNCSDIRLKINYPQNDSIVYSLKPYFQWEHGSSSGKYQLQISSDMKFKKILIFEKNIQGTSYILKEQLIPGLYYFRIRPLTPINMPGFWTEIYKMQIKNPEVNIISPSNEESVVLYGCEVKWSGHKNASEYHLEIADDIKFENPIQSTIVKNETFYKTGIFEKTGKYYIRLKTIFNNNQKTDWSSPISINVCPGYAVEVEDKIHFLSESGKICHSINNYFYKGDMSSFLKFQNINNNSKFIYGAAHINIDGFNNFTLVSSALDNNCDVIFNRYYEQYNDFYPYKNIELENSIMIFPDHTPDRSLQVLKIDKRNGDIIKNIKFKKELIDFDTKSKIFNIGDFMSIDGKIYIDFKDAVLYNDETIILTGTTNYKDTEFKGTEGSTILNCTEMWIAGIDEFGNLLWLNNYIDNNKEYNYHVFGINKDESGSYSVYSYMYNKNSKNQGFIKIYSDTGKNNIFQEYNTIKPGYDSIYFTENFSYLTYVFNHNDSVIITGRNAIIKIKNNNDIKIKKIIGDKTYKYNKKISEYNEREAINTDKDYIDENYTFSEGEEEVEIIDPEYNKDYEDGYAAGLEEGKNSGSHIGYHEGYIEWTPDENYEEYYPVDNYIKNENYNNGYNAGYKFGYSTGYSSSYIKGYSEGYQAIFAEFYYDYFIESINILENNNILIVLTVYEVEYAAAKYSLVFNENYELIYFNEIFNNDKKLKNFYKGFYLMNVEHLVNLYEF